MLERARPRQTWPSPGQGIAGLLVVALLASCAHAPHKGPKNVGALGALVAVSGGALWIAGDRSDSPRLGNVGLAITATGLVTLLVAGALMAAAVACRADADCPRGEECREIPVQPGAYPYAQCVPRNP